MIELIRNITDPQALMWLFFGFIGCMTALQVALGVWIRKITGGR